jgi:LmbE family N-acetylglucosaminyl deacetylase
LNRALAVCCTLLLAAAPRLFAQERGAAALGESVAGLGTTTRVLMIGAHPDDEDTQVIAYLSKAKHIETAYLSLTRGDGGQNLIGNELGQVLGMIRTEELLAARRIDGGRQYFTRAYDFGFSKTLDEAMERWPKDSILKDMVEIVRAFRPQVIISMWTGTPQDGHGQHQYAGVLAREVFDAAADSLKYPASKVGGLKPWSTSKFYRGRRNGAGLLVFNIGEYDPLVGKTYSQIASESRSQHRSQGQGELQERGPRLDGIRLEVSRVSDVAKAAGNETGLFDGLDTSWVRFRNVSLADSSRSAVDSLVLAERAVDAARDLNSPAAMVQPLARYVRLATRALSGISCTPLIPIEGHASCGSEIGDLELALSGTQRRAIDALLDADAVSVDVTAPRELVAQRDTMSVTLSVFDQGSVPVTLENVSLIGQLGVTTLRQPRTVVPDSVTRLAMSFRGTDAPTIAWWLRRRMVGDMFTQPMLEMVTGEDRLQETGADVMLRIGEARFPYRTGPIVHRFADIARGEVRRPISTIPEVSLLLQHEVEYARANGPLDRMMLVFVHSAAATPRDVDVSLLLPKGLTADSATRRVTLSGFGDAHLYFRVQGRLAAGHDSIKATAKIGSATYSLGFVPIEYEHIRPQRFYRSSTLQLEAVSATFANLKIGYIRGVGDNVMPMLEELGLPVTELDPVTLPQVKLGGFSTIVIGPRAYEANNDALKSNTPVLMQFVRSGGTVVTQYGQFEMAQPGYLPYPITLSRPADRVTDETAPVRVLDPGSPLLSTPNKITERDFGNWVQERSLYMPHTFDKAYRPLFSMNDKGEPPNDAAVLVAPVGKGTYVYTTMSFFRQLPAGHPGAARLFINLLSADQRAANRPAVPPSGPVRP